MIESSSDQRIATGKGDAASTHHCRFLSTAVARSPPAISTATANSITSPRGSRVRSPRQGRWHVYERRNVRHRRSRPSTLRRFRRRWEARPHRARQRSRGGHARQGRRHVFRPFVRRNSSAVVVADFDGDHRSDVLAASYPGLVLLHGNGDGTLIGYRRVSSTSIRPAAIFNPISQGSRSRISTATENPTSSPATTGSS